MNKYEGMFLLDHGKVKSEPEKGINEVSSILEKHGAKTTQIGKWDERKLAYEIKRQKRGTYVLVHFEIDPTALDDMRRDLSLSEIVNRNLLLRIEGDEWPPFMTAQELDAAYGTRDFRDRPGGGRRGDRPGGDRGGFGGGRPPRQESRDEAPKTDDAPKGEGDGES